MPTEARQVDDDLPSWERTRNSLLRSVDHILAAWPCALNDIAAIGYGTGRSYDGSGGGGGLRVEILPASGDQPAVYEIIPATGVELAALRPSRGAGWIAQLGDLIIDLCRSSHHPSGVPWTPTNARDPMRREVEALMLELPAGKHWPAGPAELVKRIEILASTGDHWWPRQPPKKGSVVAGVTIGERANTVETCGLCQQPVTGTRSDPIRRIDGNPFHKSPCWYTVTSDRQGRATA